jgi:hypothetical protein
MRNEALYDMAPELVERTREIAARALA